MFSVYIWSILLLHIEVAWQKRDCGKRCVSEGVDQYIAILYHKMVALNWMELKKHPSQRQLFGNITIALVQCFYQYTAVHKNHKTPQNDMHQLDGNGSGISTAVSQAQNNVAHKATQFLLDKPILL